MPTLQSAVSELLAILVLAVPGLSLLAVMVYLFISILNKRAKVIGQCRRVQVRPARLGRHPPLPRSAGGRLRLTMGMEIR